jgi:exopolysaccharide biosynthesis polyprenyl glycosylphosphotransferase
MTRRHLMTLRLILVLGDSVAAALVFLLVSVVRFESDPTVSWSVDFDPGLAAILFALIWVGVLWALGLYRLRVRWSLMAEARDVARATVAVLALTLSSLFLLHQDDVSRLFLAILFVAQPAVTLVSRALVRLWFDALRRRGRNTSYMLVVGTGRLAQEFADRVEARVGLGVHVVGHLSVPEAAGSGPGRARRATDPTEEDLVTRPLLGTVSQLNGLFHDRIIDEVAVCLPPGGANYLEAIVAVAADEGKTVRVPRAPEEGILTNALQEEFEGFLVRSVIHDGHQDLERAFKRLLDVVSAATALILLSPLLVGTAIAIRARYGPPVIFEQIRVGRHGRAFAMLKFRTMVVDAEERFAEVAGRNEVQGPAFKMHDDPRVTPFGSFLRRWSIDELPQLINVLKGDMSLVGPRPALPREVAIYDIWHRRRLSVRPGMTGLWQVQARTVRHFDDRAQLDLRYIDQWSLWMDLGILVRTVPVVLARTGR